MKTCFKCGLTKPFSEFYRHSAMGDGYLGKCKDCTRADVRAHRAANIERYREAERQRGREAERIARTVQYVKQWRAEHPGRNAAHVQAQRRYRIAPATCSRCQTSDRRIERHHPDYAQPLLIEWLCKPCHVIADKIRRLLDVS